MKGGPIVKEYRSALLINQGLKPREHHDGNVKKDLKTERDNKGLRY